MALIGNIVTGPDLREHGGRALEVCSSDSERCSVAVERALVMYLQSHRPVWRGRGRSLEGASRGHCLCRRRPFAIYACYLLISVRIQPQQRGGSSVTGIRVSGTRLLGMTIDSLEKLTRDLT
jgi:hypothetical protein